MNILLTGTNGRPRKRGKRLPTPRQMLTQRSRRLSLNIYGRQDRSRVSDRVAYLYVMPERPVRVVADEPLTGERKRQAFYSTRHDASAAQVLTWYARRWSIEETFHDAKGSLGFEEPQGWSKRAVERTAPTAMPLYSLVLLWFARCGHRSYHPLQRPWYRCKSRASFTGMLATLREASIREQASLMQPAGRGRRKLVKCLIHAVKQAA